MKIFYRSILSISLAMAGMNAMAMEVTDKFDFFGYARAGVFSSSGDGTMKESFGGTDFQKNKLGRFGNEFDVYAEVGLGADLYQEGDKKVYTQMMFNMWDGDTDSDTTNEFGWENMNIQFMNFLGMNENVWAGIRQYNKGYVIDMNDFFYWNGTGIGAGIEGMEVGPGKMSVAILQRDFAGQKYDEDGIYVGGNDANQDSINANNFELMYYDLPLWDGGKLALGYKFLQANATNDEIENIGEQDYADGHAVLIELHQALANNGWNRTALQYYADGSALQGVTFGKAQDLNGTVDSGWGYALRNYGNIPMGDDWELSHAINYAAAEDIELQDGTKGDAASFAISAKTTYHWSDITRTYFEAGYFDDEKTEGNSDFDRSGSKLTLGQALSWGRGQPEIRVFASYFDSDNDNWDDTANAFENSTSDDTWTVGVQANLWW